MVEIFKMTMAEANRLTPRVAPLWYMPKKESNPNTMTEESTRKNCQLRPKLKLDGRKTWRQSSIVGIGPATDLITSLRAEAAGRVDKNRLSFPLASTDSITPFSFSEA